MYMRKVFAIFLITGGLFCCAFAQESGNDADTKESVGAEHKIHDMKGKGMMPGMMGAPRSMVASSDGGVFVLMGNKLQKYDKNLVLQKEVEIKMPADMMQKMKKKCPMMDDESKDASEEPQALKK